MEGWTAKGPKAFRGVMEALFILIWWWFKRYFQWSKFIQLFTLNGGNLLCINHSSIKLTRKKIILENRLLRKIKNLNPF